MTRRTAPAGARSGSAGGEETQMRRGKMAEELTGVGQKWGDRRRSMEGEWELTMVGGGVAGWGMVAGENTKVTSRPYL